MNVELYNTTVVCTVHGMHLEGWLSKWSACIRRSNVCAGYVWKEQQPAMQKRDAAATRATIQPRVQYTS